MTSTIKIFGVHADVGYVEKLTFTYGDMTEGYV